MTKTAPLGLLLVGALVGAFGATPARAAAPARHVQDLSRRYLEALFRAKPHLATFMGDHRFDGAFPDLSAEALKRREAELVVLSVILLAWGIYTKTWLVVGMAALGLPASALYLRKLWVNPPISRGGPTK